MILYCLQVIHQILIEHMDYLNVIDTLVVNPSVH
ncbi:unnamed protein product [Schistosoma curassoni]|uniref:Uncharacterized protein n=1 Tax=Schistosoma curassoni TaxID=6186 RepID=A0A183JVC2_9TREM|nr:unnamed protein product [Schistosoma curassoni]